MVDLWLGGLAANGMTAAAFGAVTLPSDAKANQGTLTDIRHLIDGTSPEDGSQLYPAAGDLPHQLSGRAP